MDGILDYLGSAGLNALAGVVDIVIIVLGGLCVYGAKLALTKLGLSVDSALFQQIEAVIDTAVTSTNQTIVSKLKAESENGSLTDAQMEDVFNTTKEKVLQALTSTEMDAIANKYLNLDDGLKELIEKYVYLNH